MPNISEKDLYDYVMHPENLSLDKTMHILNNIDGYIDKIVYLEAFKDNLNMKVSSGQINKTHNKINEMNKTVKVLLRPLKRENNSEYLKFAAESARESVSAVVLTFQDENKEYLIKLNTTEKRSKLFLFGSNLDENANYSLSVNPSGEKFHINLDNQPLITDPIHNIESFELSLTSIF
jgi:hypothetical protein